MASYAPLTNEPEYSNKGWTSAEAEAQTKKWGKNEIPEEKEPVRAQPPIESCPSHCARPAAAYARARRVPHCHLVE